MKRQTLIGIAFSLFALNAFAATETDPLFSDAVAAATQTDPLFSDAVAAATQTDPLFSDAVAEGGSDRLIESRNA
ncbi:hypothetical protein [Pseudomonas sp. BW7P1]|uniref:hypothetical protein n=1 Tax=Pseudomonas TaxID=286 RepID=UPI0021ADB174|nr:hypothetical protein [Pseudomonas sp. BW7P1]UWI64194.1 hypothetical protein NWV16_12595 [Pseudomonas sp. BW7P1]